jgi:hypothetical protein
MPMWPLPKFPIRTSPVNWPKLAEQALHPKAHRGGERVNANGKFAPSNSSIPSAGVVAAELKL